MKKLLLKNATLQLLTGNKVVFIGEIKGYIQKLSWTITQERHDDLLQLDNKQKYNIWQLENEIRFKSQAN